MVRSESRSFADRFLLCPVFLQLSLEAYEEATVNVSRFYSVAWACILHFDEGLLVSRRGQPGCGHDQKRFPE
jgi:hypothetical protein